MRTAIDESNRKVLARTNLKRRIPTTLKKVYWSSRGHYDQLAKIARLVRPLYGFFKDRVTIQQAEEEIKKALEAREQRFLDLIQLYVYQFPNSPYYKLLKYAGCEFSDLQIDVRKNGLDNTLERLARAGVYLTAAEFKGKSVLKRGNLTLQLSPADFEMKSAPAISVESSGTTGAPVLAFLTLDYLKIHTFGMAAFFAANDLLRHSHAIYDSVLPSGTGSIVWLLAYARLGIVTDRWFARATPGNAPFGSRYDRLTTTLLVALGNLVGPGFPKPEKLDIRDVDRIVLWILEKRKEGQKCCLRATSSNVARIARRAEEKGISLENAVFVAGGEPVTEGKRQLIERVSARVIPRYTFTEAGVVGFACANPVFTDDVHVNEYMLGVIRHPNPITEDDLPIHPLLFTSLYPSSSHLLLNVANGDFATMDRRACGCALERVGLTLHFHGIGSYEKLNAEGMNYLYTDLFELFEGVLPREFGGAPGDYQLVEEEDSSSQTRLTVRVSPEVGVIDEVKLVARVQGSLEKGLHTRFWKDAGTFRVKREFPHAGRRGKIWPLHRSH